MPPLNCHQQNTVISAPITVPLLVQPTDNAVKFHPLPGFAAPHDATPAAPVVQRPQAIGLGALVVRAGWAVYLFGTTSVELSRAAPETAGMWIVPGLAWGIAAPHSVAEKTLSLDW